MCKHNKIMLTKNKVTSQNTTSHVLSVVAGILLYFAKQKLFKQYFLPNKPQLYKIGHRSSIMVKNLLLTLKEVLSLESSFLNQSILIEMLSWNQQFFPEPHLFRDYHYMQFPQTLLYRISTVQSFKSYLGK